MSDNIYIVVADIDFLDEQDFCDTFLYGQNDEILDFCEEHYGQVGDDMLLMYDIDEFLGGMNRNEIDLNYKFFRKLIKTD